MHLYSISGVAAGSVSEPLPFRSNAASDSVCGTRGKLEKSAIQYNSLKCDLNSLT